MKQKIIILDPDCRHTKSHNLMASFRAAAAAKAAGYDVDAVINRSFPVEDRTLDDLCGRVSRTWPTFAFNDQDEAEVCNLTKFHPVFDGNYTRWEKYHFALLQLHEEEQISGDSIFFIHTTSAPALMGIMQYLLSISPHQRPRFFCLLYCMHEIIQGPQLEGVSNLDVLNRLRTEGLIGTNIFFHVETRGLQEHYRLCGFDFPIGMGPLEPIAPPRTTKVAAETRIVSFFGEARAEKGFQHIPTIIETFLRLDQPVDVEFRIQTYSNPSNDTLDIQSAKKRLHELQRSGAQITLLGNLSPDDFKAEMLRTDIVMMPYEARDYRARGSGVAYDALTSRARIVCTPDTDIERTFYDCGVTAPLKDNPEEFAAEIARVLSSDDELKLSFLESYDIDSFFSTLFDIHDVDNVAPQETNYQMRALNALVLPVSGGHGFVEQAQLKVLQKLNVQTVLLGVPWVNSLDGTHFFQKEFVRYYFSSEETIGFPIVFPKLTDGYEFERIYKLYKMGKLDFYSHTNFLSVIENYIECGPVLEEILAISPIEAQILNYSWLQPLVDKVNAANRSAKVRSVCEVHDYQGHQNILRRRAYASKHGLRWREDEIISDLAVETDAEIASIAAFDHRIFISETLKSQLAAPGGKNDLVAFPPNAHLRERPAGDSHAATISRSDFAQASALSKVEILFVGTAHQANQNSLIFLLDEVMPVVRRTQSATLHIVGSIDQLFSNEMKADYARKGDIFVGPVDDVARWYEAAQIIALSVTEGTGFPTKVIEAMSFGKCFSANKAALYELHNEASGRFAICETSRDMADDILGLLADRELRNARGAAGRQFYDDYFSLGLYAQQWAKALGIAAIGDFTEPEYHQTELEHHQADISLNDAELGDPSVDEAEILASMGYPQWSVTEVRDLDGFRFINLQVASFAAGNGSYLTHFYVKLIRHGESIALEMREDDGAFQLLGDPAASFVETDDWGRVVRIFVDSIGAYDGPPLSSISENTAYLDRFLSNLPEGVASCDLEDQEEWVKAATVISRLRVRATPQDAPSLPDGWIKRIISMLLPGRRKT